MYINILLRRNVYIFFRWDLFVTCQDRFQVRSTCFWQKPANQQAVFTWRWKRSCSTCLMDALHCFLVCLMVLLFWMAHYGTLKIWLDESSMIPSIVKTNLLLAIMKNCSLKTMLVGCFNSWWTKLNRCSLKGVGGDLSARELLSMSFNLPRFLLQRLLQEQPVSNSSRRHTVHLLHCTIQSPWEADVFSFIAYDCAQFHCPSQSFSRNGRCRSLTCLPYRWRFPSQATSLRLGGASVSEAILPSTLQPL